MSQSFQIKQQDLINSYKIFQLDINKNYSEEQVKKQFKKQAIKYHPDKTKNNNSEKYIQLQEAFKIIILNLKLKQSGGGAHHFELKKQSVLATESKHSGQVEIEQEQQQNKKEQQKIRNQLFKDQDNNSFNELFQKNYVETDPSVFQHYQNQMKPSSTDVNIKYVPNLDKDNFNQFFVKNKLQNKSKQLVLYNEPKLTNVSQLTHYQVSPTTVQTFTKANLGTQKTNKQNMEYCDYLEGHTFQIYDETFCKTKEHTDLKLALKKEKEKRKKQDIQLNESIGQQDQSYEKIGYINDVNSSRLIN